MNNLNQINPIQEIIASRAVRTNLAFNSHEWFFAIYLQHYLTNPTAPMHKDFFSITENTNEKLSVIVAFRGSGKSTIMTLSYPIWAIIGVMQCKFVLILSQTQAQARYHMMNLRRELETNDLLRSDFVAFEEDTDQWGLGSIVIPKYNARITVASSEQSIRGIRNQQYRPDLIICDDVEDLNSVKTKEGRDRTFGWLTGEVVPAGQPGITKMILIGNLLHDDSLLMRLKERIDHKNLDGKFYWYPLIDENKNITWPGKFPSMAQIETLKRSIASEASWQREYLLRIIIDQERVVHPDWIQYYPKLPKQWDGDYRYTAIGVDLAISKKDTADYTAMVAAMVFGRRDNMRAYILPNPVNERLTYPEQINRVKLMSENLQDAKLFIEDVGYQKSLVQDLEQQGYEAEGVQVHGDDKRARLATITHHIQSGKILFPEHGAENLINQLTGFGTEKHDDLADAFSILGHKIIENDTRCARGFTFKPIGL
ncbi:MAG: phage terminase large subunit [bacterium]|nr:phage terminase large subunit [bacterium]